MLAHILAHFFYNFSDDVTTNATAHKSIPLTRVYEVAKSAY